MSDSLPVPETFQEVEKEIRANELDEESLSAETLFTKIDVFLLTFFSNSLNNFFNASAPNGKQWQVAILALSVLIILYQTEFFYLKYFAPFSLQESKNWTKIWLRFLGFITLTATIIAIQSVFSLISGNFNLDVHTLPEIVMYMVFFMLVFFRVMYMYKNFS